VNSALKTPAGTAIAVHGSKPGKKKEGIWLLLSDHTKCL
jgi:hypothetical protein